MTPSCDILGVPVAPLGYEELLAHLESLPAPGTGRCARVVFANVHVVTEAALKPEYSQALRDAEIVVPDGMPLVWACRLLGARLRDRCYGPEFMARALARSGHSGWRHYFYGSTPLVIEALEARVRRQWPGAPLAGSRAAPFGPFDDAVERDSVEAINAANPDWVWLGLGCPRQELWLQRYGGLLACRAACGVGAAFDFLGQTKRQAPPWMQRNGLEWAFRVWTEPRRLGPRYLLRNPYFVVRFALQWLCGSRQRRSGPVAGAAPPAEGNP